MHVLPRLSLFAGALLLAGSMNGPSPVSARASLGSAMHSGPAVSTVAHDFRPAALGKQRAELATQAQPSLENRGAVGQPSSQHDEHRQNHPNGSTSATGATSASGGGVVQGMPSATGNGTATQSFPATAAADPALGGMDANAGKPSPPIQSDFSSSGGTTTAHPGGGSETLASCMSFWEPATHMSKQEWRRTCQRTLNGINLPDETGTVTPVPPTSYQARAAHAKHAASSLHSAAQSQRFS